MSATGKAVAKTAAQSALGNPHFDYAVKDCQGWVEWCWLQNGYKKDYTGSNAMYRQACVWTGTKEQCIAKYGKIPAGAMTFKIRAFDPVKCNAKYNDGIGDVYHVGLYCAGIDGVEVGHSSNGGSQTAKLSTWGYIGITKDLEYDFGGLADKYPDEDSGVDEAAPQATQLAVVTSGDGNPVKLRKDPSTKNPYLDKISVGTLVTVLEQATNSAGEEWSKIIVQWSGKRGYMMSYFLKISG